MGRQKISDFKKLIKYIQEFKGEFIEVTNGRMYCQLCNKIIDFNKRNHVLSHRQTKTHQNRLMATEQLNLHQTFVVDKNPDFTRRITDVFLSANIPLHKLENKKIKDLFNYL